MENKDNTLNNNSISIVGDYTPSQNIIVNTNKNMNLGLKNKQFSINVKPNYLPKSRLRYHLNPLTNSIDDDAMRQMRTKEYENAINSAKSNIIISFVYVLYKD